VAINTLEKSRLSSVLVGSAFNDMKKQRSSKTPTLSESQISDLSRQYLLSRPLQEEFTAKTVELIKALLHVQRIEAHLIESRTKEPESFREKINRSPHKYQNPLNEITDLSGIRIIVYYEKELNTISELIAKEFDIDWSNSSDKRKAHKPEEFGYQSIHYVVKLSKSRSSLLEWHHLAGLQAEIQVRTVLQHAWAAISHKLQYKREEDVPQILRRRLFRLSALLELADEEFMILRDKTNSLAEVVQYKLAEGDTDVEVNGLTIGVFLNTSQVVSAIVTDAQRAGFGFEPHPGDNDEDDFSDLVALCNFLGLKTIFNLKVTLEHSTKWSYEYLLKQMQSNEGFWDASPSFISQLILIKAFSDRITISYLLKAGWDRGIAERVLKVASE